MTTKNLDSNLPDDHGMQLTSAPATSGEYPGRAQPGPAPAEQDCDVCGGSRLVESAFSSTHYGMAPCRACTGHTPTQANAQTPAADLDDVQPDPIAADALRRGRAALANLNARLTANREAEGAPDQTSATGSPNITPALGLCLCGLTADLCIDTICDKACSKLPAR